MQYRKVQEQQDQERQAKPPSQATQSCSSDTATKSRRQEEQQEQERQAKSPPQTTQSCSSNAATTTDRRRRQEQPEQERQDAAKRQRRERQQREEQFQLTICHLFYGAKSSRLQPAALPTKHAAGYADDR